MFEQLKDFILRGEYEKAHRLYSDTLYDIKEHGYNDGQSDGIMSSVDLVDDWIAEGEHDGAVEKRASGLGMTYISSSTEMFETTMQVLHEANCGTRESAPYGWEFCGKCNK